VLAKTCAVEFWGGGETSYPRRKLALTEKGKRKTEEFKVSHMHVQVPHLPSTRALGFDKKNKRKQATECRRRGGKTFSPGQAD